MSLVVCNLPKAGLGNWLYPLMKALVFGHLNNLPVIITGYHQIKIGPYLRKERTKRNYIGYFTFQRGLIGELSSKVSIKLRKVFGGYKTINEPFLEKTHIEKRVIYQFSEVPHWSNLFDQLRNHRSLVIELFWKMLDGEIKRSLDKLPAPEIGIHIRLGDFKKLASYQDFAKVGAVRTPQQYFREMINGIRQLKNSTVSVSIFTDGYKRELEKILALDNVKIVDGNNDIVDMLLLSKSKIIVTSAGSTFSYWSGFLSNAHLILHPDHIYEPIRPRSDELYEGPLNLNDLTLRNLLRQV